VAGTAPATALVLALATAPIRREPKHYGNGGPSRRCRGHPPST
jgi:hypothetical protein